MCFVVNAVAPASFLEKEGGVVDGLGAFGCVGVPETLYAWLHFFAICQGLGGGRR